jgi:hypothetical protein
MPARLRVDPANLEEIRRLIATGVIDPKDLVPPKSPRRRKSADMVAVSFHQPDADRCVWEWPIVTASEANGREWRKRSNRTKAARDVVSRHMAPTWKFYGPIGDHWRAGGVIRAVFTRLGGHVLDAANVGTALKATEDAVCLILGVDDRPPLWLSTFDQVVKTTAGGLQPVGVRVELTIVRST